MRSSRRPCYKSSGGADAASESLFPRRRRRDASLHTSHAHARRRMLTDEAQMCKTGGPEMAVELTKINRWAVTGTPLSDSFDDLVSQLYFLELERGSASLFPFASPA